LNNSNLKTIDKCNYNYSGNCFSECINDTNDNLICKGLYDENCIEYLIYSVIPDLCIYCYNGNGYYPAYNQYMLNSDTFINCNKELEGYFLDNDYAYKPCFNSCKTCLKEGNETNNNCKECKENYRILNDSQNNDLNNCYMECGENYYYFDSLNIYRCTDIKECPNEYKLIKGKNKCIDNCTKDDEYRLEFNNSCLKGCPPNHTQYNNIYLKVQDTIADTNLHIINTESVANTNIQKNTESVADTNMQKNTESDADTNLHIINTESVADTNMQKNTESVTDNNMQKNTESDTDTNVKKNTESFTDKNMQKDIESVTDTNVKKNTESVVVTNVHIININEKEECPKDFPYGFQNDRECIKECNAKNLFIGICTINNKDSTIKDDMINNIRNELINYTMDELLKDVIGGKKEDNHSSR